MSRHHALIKNDPRWKAARAACLDRDDHACVECGATEQLEADHIIELAVAPELAFDLDNLQTLCRPCHTAKGLAAADVIRNAWLHPDYPELADLIEPPGF